MVEHSRGNCPEFRVLSMKIMWAIKTFGSKLHARRAAKRINDHRIEAIRKTGGGSIHGAATIEMSYRPIYGTMSAIGWDVVIPVDNGGIGTRQAKRLRRIMLGAVTALSQES